MFLRRTCMYANRTRYRLKCKLHNSCMKQLLSELCADIETYICSLSPYRREQVYRHTNLTNNETPKFLELGLRITHMSWTIFLLFFEIFAWDAEGSNPRMSLSLLFLEFWHPMFYCRCQYSSMCTPPR